MQMIYLAKPGAQKEGPYTLEQINRDLAAKKISETDFWAWHDGLPAWAPLYSIPGVSAKPCVDEPLASAEIIPKREAASRKPEPSISRVGLAPQPRQVEVNRTAIHAPKPAKPAIRVAPQVLIAAEPQRVESGNSPMPLATAPAENSEPSAVPSLAAKLASQNSKAAVEIAEAVEPEPAIANAEPVLAESSETDAPIPDPAAKRSEILAAPSMHSGKPFEALERIFLFTTGEGPSALQSEITLAMLAEAVGRRADETLAKVTVDVIGGTAARVVREIRAGSIPGSAWRALHKIKEAVAQEIHDGIYHLCVRTFPVESKDLVALFLLYNKQKL